MKQRNKAEINNENLKKELFKDNYLPSMNNSGNIIVDNRFDLSTNCSGYNAIFIT